MKNQPRAWIFNPHILQNDEIMNRLDALKYFVVAAENLSFKMTALRFSVSPQVITRVIAELENELGEALFKRNTRAIHLTAFGEQFYPQALDFLRQEERLFQPKSKGEDELTGTVRVTLPPSHFADRLLQKLLEALAPYPQIAIDWRTDFEPLKDVTHQIDIGIRIENRPEDHWVAKKIKPWHEVVVASPALIARTGLPKDMFDLVEHFPVGNMLNPKTGKAWDWYLDERILPLANANVVTSDVRSLLYAVLAGRIFAPMMFDDCQEYIARGELQIVCNAQPSERLALYLYRPYQPITPKRVLMVFELLEKILAEMA